MNRHYVTAALYIISGGVFLFIGLRSEPRQTAWVILGPVFLVLGLLRLMGARRRSKSGSLPGR